MKVVWLVRSQRIGAISLAIGPIGLAFSEECLHYEIWLSNIVQNFLTRGLTMIDISLLLLLMQLLQKIVCYQLKV